MSGSIELSKADTAQVLNKLRTQHSNKTCFDCSSKNPSWASVTYGIFICIDCSAVHRSLGVHLSFVRSTLLDTSWSWPQLRSMQLGGNQNAHQFFQQHNCNIKDQSQKYNSRVAQLYRDKLSQSVSNSLKVYGYVLELPTLSLSSAISKSETNKTNNDDFFDEASLFSMSSNAAVSNNDCFTSTKKSVAPLNSKDGPNVTSNISADKISDYKPSVIGRKTTASKKGLGARKGLGAQKVQTDFNKLEQEAIFADQFKESNANNAKISNLSPEEQEEKLNSIKLAHQEKQKITENRLKSTDPNKVIQLERLGMGFANIGLNRPSAKSHSALSDMKINEENNTVAPSRSNKDFSDSYMNDLGFSSSSSYKYKDIIKQNDDFWNSNGVDWNDGGAFDKKPIKKPDVIEAITTIDLDRNHNKSRTKPNTSNVTTNSTNSTKGASTNSSEEAQKKFGNAKAISSEQFFENDRSSNDDRRSSSRFEGSRGISSDDYFGRSSTDRESSMSANFNSANLYDIKEGVKDSVSKIAGRISNMATDVVKTINKLDIS